MISLLTICLVLWAKPGYSAEPDSVDDLCPDQVLQDYESKYFSAVNSTCFLFVTNDIITYDEALKSCKSFDGDLAMPKTKDLNDFLVQEMKDLDQTEDMWIGMHQRTTGLMEWEDGTEVADWGNFRVFSQDARFFNGFITIGNGKECVAINPKNGQWRDYRCENKFHTRDAKLPYICQFK